MQGNKKKIGTAVVACLVAVGIAGSMVGASTPEEPRETVDKSVYVDTGSPVRGNITLSSEFIGTVEPDQSVVVYPRLAGEVLAVNYAVGDTVEAGAVLVELDARDLQYTVSQTRAAINAAENRLQLGIEMTEQERENFLSGLETNTNADVIKAEAEVRAAEIEVQAASTSLRSARRIWREAKNGESDVYVTDEQVSALKDAVSGAELQLEAAQLKQEAAEEALAAVRKAIGDGQTSYDQSVAMAELNADLSEQYIALQSLQATLGDAQVRAPISGTIEYRYLDAHDMASPATPAYVISNKDVMTVSFSIPEASLPYVRQGDPVTLEKNGQTCTGAITEISSMVVGGLYPVKASVEQPPFEMNTGSTVKIYADTQKALDSVLVPIDAVHYSGGDTSVFLYENGVARKVEIQTGISDEQYIQVVSGLSTSDQLITTWNSKLSDGLAVLLPGQEPAAADDPDDQAGAAVDAAAEETADGDADPAGDAAATEAADSDTASEDGDGEAGDDEERGGGELIPAA